METKNNANRISWASHQKRWFGKWHLYLGIVAGGIVAFVGLTGSILVFQDEIDRALNPKLFEVLADKQKIPPENIIPLIAKSYPTLKIDYLVLGNIKNSNEAYSILSYKTSEEIFINPYTGKVSGKRLYASSFIKMVTELHKTLFVPVIGRYLVGLASLSLLILTISGLRLWLPNKWKLLRPSLAIKFSGSSKRKNYDWHNILGFYSSPVVAMLSLTGFCIAFSTAVIPMLFLLSGKSPKDAAKLLGAKSAWHKEATAAPLKDIITSGKESMPGATVAAIVFPSDKLGSYRLDMVSGDVPRTGKREMLIIDQYTGRVLLNSRNDFPNLGNAYLAWLTPIHYGNFGGRPTQIVAIIAGLIPLTLFITGFVIWWPRYKKRKASKTIHTVAIFASPTKNPQQSEIFFIEPLPKLGKYFILQFKSGLKYAGFLIPISFIMGILYGLPSGIIIQPAVFMLSFSCVMVCLNFICASLSEFFNLLFLLPFKKGSYSLTRYFALSSAFAICYILICVLIVNTGINIF